MIWFNLFIIVIAYAYTMKLCWSNLISSIKNKNVTFNIKHINIIIHSTHNINKYSKNIKEYKKH